MGVTAGQMETCLASAFEVPGEQKKAFKAKLRNFKNLGVPNDNHPGSGKRQDYTWPDVLRVCFAMEFTAAGLQPLHIVTLMPCEDILFQAATYPSNRLLVGEDLDGNEIRQLTRFENINWATWRRAVFVDLAETVRRLKYDLRFGV